MMKSDHPGQRSMQRQDREISNPAAVRAILERAMVCRLAMCDGEWPYLVPLNYGLHKDRLYFHCASEGKKLDLLRANPRVCFEVEGRIALVTGERACDWTTQYESVIGYGMAAVVVDETERRLAMEALMRQAGAARELHLPETLPTDMPIVRIEIHGLSGKTSFPQE